jgi:hypothetical protein
VASAAVAAEPGRWAAEAEDIGMSSSPRNMALIGVVALVVGGVSGYALRGSAQPANQLPSAAPAKTVEAERFILKNGQGKMMAVLDLNPDGLPLFALFDKNGQSRAQVSLSPGPDSQPFISLSDKDGKAIFYAPQK